MFLDFSLIQDPKVAVFCATEDQAEAFCDEMRRQYPERMALWEGRSYWSHRYESDPGICYSPYINGNNGYMTWSSRTHYLREGFTVINFEELCREGEDIQFDESQLEALFS